MVIPVYTTILGAIILFRLDGKVKKKKFDLYRISLYLGFYFASFHKIFTK